MKIAIVFGTRPELIKLAPVIFALQKDFDLATIFSGQHTSLVENALSFFGIKPDYNFDCMNRKADLGALTAKIHKEMSGVFRKERPGAIVVQGDTMTAYTAAFQGFLNKIPVAHVEAGLRTNNKFSPYPEEMLRNLVSRIADFHFAPTESAKKNLLREKTRGDRILVTGNTVVDSLLMAERLLDEREVTAELAAYSPGIKGLLEKKKIVLVTSHRRENIAGGLREICSAINTLAMKHGDALFIWPLHKNPDVRKGILESINRRAGNILLTEALSYPATVYLMRKSFMIMTDSGGIQEEAPTFKHPVLVLREFTERPEVVESGIGFLTGADEKKIISAFSRLWEDKKFYRSVTGIKNPFGDGKASRRILNFFRSREVMDFMADYPGSSGRKFKIGFKE